jgi:hypothetical protein
MVFFLLFGWDLIVVVAVDAKTAGVVQPRWQAIYPLRGGET